MGFPVPSEPAERTTPAVIDVHSMTKLEKEKFRRLVTPKKYSGNLDVPKDIADLWNSPGGKEKLCSMWAKSGGIKAGHSLRNLIYLFFASRNFRIC